MPFNGEAYAKKVKMTDDRVLRKKHHAKIRSHHACLFSIAWGIGLAPVTCGMSLMGTVYSATQTKVLRQQLAAIMQEIANRGLEIPRHRKRDWLYGMTLGLSGAYIGIGIGHGIHHLINPAAGVVLATVPGAIDGAIQGAQNVGTTEIDKFGDDLDPSAFDTPTQLPAGDGDTSGDDTSNVGFSGGGQLDVTAIDATQKQLGSAITQGATKNRVSKSERPRRNRA